MISRLVNSLAYRLGYELNVSEAVRHLGYDMEDEARQKIRLVRSHTMLPYRRLITLYQQAVFCEKNEIQGSYVECGTWKGGAIGLMALANLQHATVRRDLHLFDSFEGLPEPDEAIDGEKAAQFARDLGARANGKLAPLEGAFGSVGTLEINKQLLEKVVGYDTNHLHYYKGWFQDTLPRHAADVGDIAILRLDGDWYSSQSVCLDYLYDKVVSGGFVIIDDYGWFDGDRRAVDEFMQRKQIRAFLNHIDNAGRYWIKR
jgi:O-methyltransferase